VLIAAQLKLKKSRGLKSAMLNTKNRKRRIIHFKTYMACRKIKNSEPCPFRDHLEQMKRDWLALINRLHLAKDTQFLRRMAINIKHLHHDALHSKRIDELRTLASQIEHFLSTPLGAPFVAKETLVKAAYLFSEQDPKDSDLSEILGEFSHYGACFPMQLLSLFN
jgi:hypothetical protein